MGSFQLNFLKKEQSLRSSVWGHHFFFLNTILAIFIGFAYVYAAPSAESFISFIYLLVTWLGQIAFLSFLIFLVIFFPLAFIGSFKTYRVVAIVLAIFCHCLLLVDAKLFITIKVHLTWMVTSLMIRDLDFNSGLNFNFMYIAIPLLIILELIFARLATREIYRRDVRHNYFPAIVLSLVTICFVASHGIYIWADATNYEKITNLRTVFPAHYPMTAKSFLSNHGWLEDGVISEDGTSHAVINYPLAEIRTVQPQENVNVIQILVNGLSYSDLNEKNTPNLLALKSGYTSFESHYLPYYHLEDNLYAISFGLPIQYKESFVKHSVESVVVNELQKQEYITRVFTLKNEFSLKIEDPHLLGMQDNRVRVFDKDYKIFDGAYNFIKDLKDDQHFAIMLNTGSLTTVSGERFESRLRTLDNDIAHFVKQLEQNGTLENTVVMITSAVGSNDTDNSASIYSRRHQHVPFIMMMPHNQLKAVAVNVLSSHFDVIPTLGLEIVGIQTPCVNYSIGNSLLKLVDRDYMITNVGKNLLVVTKDDVTVYRRNGKAHTDNEGLKQDVRPNLETLIRAMRDLNRFRG